MEMNKLGIQLYSLRNSIQSDFYGTLKKVAEIGYRNVQFHSMEGDVKQFFSHETNIVREWLDELGLNPIYISANDVHPETVDESLRLAKSLKCTRICVPIHFFTDERDVLQFAQDLNEAGKRCRAEGVQLFYHNHFHEFQKMGGKTILNLLLENTEPENVSLELDVYWAMRGGQDPVQLFQALQNRIRLVHLKDLGEGARPVDLFETIPAGIRIDQREFVQYAIREDAFTEIGRGTLAFSPMVRAMEAAGCVEYFSVEQDYSRIGEIESAEWNYKTLLQFI